MSNDGSNDGSSEGAAAHLEEILALASRALALADQAEDYLLGAKLSEVLFSVRARLAGIGEQG